MSHDNVAEEKDDLLLSIWLKIVSLYESLSVAYVYEYTKNIAKDNALITFVSEDKAKELR